jgi:hypothetical protein
MFELDPQIDAAIILTAGEAATAFTQHKTDPAKFPSFSETYITEFEKVYSQLLAVVIKTHS